MEVALIGDVDVRSFREEKNYIIDVAFQQADKAAAMDTNAPSAPHGSAPAKQAVGAPVAHEKPIKEGAPALQQPERVAPVTSETFAEQAKVAIKPEQAPKVPTAEKAAPAAEHAAPATEQAAAAAEKAPPAAETTAPAPETIAQETPKTALRPSRLMQPRLIRRRLLHRPGKRRRPKVRRRRRLLPPHRQWRASPTKSPRPSMRGAIATVCA